MCEVPAQSPLLSGAFEAVLGHTRSELEHLSETATLSPSTFGCGSAKPGLWPKWKI